jgi:uncharacterized protein YggE
MTETIGESLPQQPSPQPSSGNGRRLTIALASGLVLSLLAVAVLATMLVSGSSSGEVRTVSVSGQATLKAVPDEYVFNPTYSFSNNNKDAALADMTKKSEEVTSGLKKLGVDSTAINTNSNGYDSPKYPQPAMMPDSAGSDNTTYSLQMTVTLSNKDQVQKVQDYLLTTSPSGAVSPQATFSTAMRKELESKARNEATKDARSKADQSANNLGFKVGKVKSVDDGSGFGGIMPYDVSGSTAMTREDSTAPSLAVQPGENEFNYSVSVVYEIR